MQFAHGDASIYDPAIKQMLGYVRDNFAVGKLTKVGWSGTRDAWKQAVDQIIRTVP